MTIHFVFFKRDLIQMPFAGTREISARLSKRYDVKVYDCTEQVTIRPEPGDILIGWPERREQTVYYLSMRQSGWARRILILPFASQMLHHHAGFDPLVEAVDIYLAICGRYWFDSVDSSPFSHWRYKMVHCDLAVNREHFPAIKPEYNPPGKRRFLYIGRQSPSDYKGIDFLCQLADANPSLPIGWIGEGTMPSPRVVPHGYHDFSNPKSLSLVSTYDFLITCGRADPNPTTILEAASWGLIPVATPQSGYYEDDWLVNIPLDNVPGASLILEKLNSCPNEELMRRQASGFRQLDAHYNWDRIASQLINAIEGPIPVQPKDEAWQIRKRQNQALLRAAVQEHRRKASISSFIGLPSRAFRKISRILGKLFWKSNG